MITSTALSIGANWTDFWSLCCFARMKYVLKWPLWICIAVLRIKRQSYATLLFPFHFCQLLLFFHFLYLIKVDDPEVSRGSFNRKWNKKKMTHFYLIPSSVTRLGNFLHFGQPFKASDNNYFTQGREPWSSGYGKRLTFKGHGFKSWHHILDGKFFTYICCKIVLMFVWKDRK